MSIATVIRSVVPPRARAKLRRLSAVNRFLAYWYGGVKSAAHPRSPYRLYFDGYRNIGWTLGGLNASESAEFDFARTLLARRRCECAWDVGANVGQWSLFLAGIEPSIRTIVCFEPDLINQSFLRMNKEKNQIDRMMIRPVSLSSQPGQATFYSDPLTGSTGSLDREADFVRAQYGGQRREVQVQVSTVDKEVEDGTPPPQFMKIDVEGFELNVLEGAQKTLQRYRPWMVMEVTRNLDAVGQLLQEHRYRLMDPHTGQALESPQIETACIPAEEAWV